MSYFTNKHNRITATLIIMIFNIAALVSSISGIAGLKITRGTEYGKAYAFTGNLFLACFTIFFSLLMTVFFIILYLKQTHNNNSLIFGKWNQSKLNTFFFSFVIVTFIILVGSIIVFVQRDNTFRWYAGWWRNFGKLT